MGHNILDSGFNLEIIIKQGAGAFVCGEETALMNSIEGKRGQAALRRLEAALLAMPVVTNSSVLAS